MNVLSLFDGMSCGQIALNKLGIKYDNYYASEIDKHAIKVTQVNYPDTIQIGDVTKLTNENLPIIDLLFGGSPCFTENNYVMTKHGYIPIQLLKIGDEVLTHKNRYKKILKIGSDYKSTLLIKSQGSTEIETTDNHPFYCTSKNKVWYNGGRNYDNNFSDYYWKNIIDFNNDDKVVSLKLKTEIDIPEFTDTDLYILGRFVADGCCWKTKRKHRKNSYIYNFKISIGKHEIDEFKSKVDDRFSYTEERTVYNAFIYRKKWVELGQKFGHKSHNKFIPNFILDLPVDRLKIFLNGYMDGDGCKRPNNYKRNTTVSELLTLTLSLAIQKCYYGVSLNKTIREEKKVIEGRIVNQKDSYSVTYNETTNKKSRFHIKNEYISYDVKVKVKHTILKKVYNIEVEDDNSYVVNNLIVHNCQGFSFAGKQLNFDDPRSKLFFEFVRILKKTKPKYFLLENVKMKKEYEQVITNHMGVKPIEINSSLLSAQNRSRLYWTNIPGIEQPNDKNINLIDILDDLTFTNKGTIIGRRLNSNGKREDYNKDIPIIQCLEVRKTNTNKSNCLTTVSKDNVLSSLDFGRHPDAFSMKDFFRYYTVKECCRLQNVPDDYFYNIVSDSQTRKMLGNGWTVDVIKHIFSYMKGG